MTAICDDAWSGLARHHLFFFVGEMVTSSLVSDLCHCAYDQEKAI
jgi:hypothetical protein